MNSKTGATYDAIYRVVKRIPRGKVATYGQVARLAGFPNHARLVGYAMHSLNDTRVPWHRVINAQGKISLRDLSAEIQRGLLEEEGVWFSSSDVVDLKRFRWNR
jgi:methylated-DNA-protein-cysteine methyltransferase related protein